eukprot:jgi/Bigna1/87030/estExt_fgenesh1_pg.C_160065
MSSHDSNYSKKGRASSRLRKLRVRYEKPLDFDPFLEESSYSSPSTMCDVHQRLTSEVRITGVCYDKGRNVWLGHWHENNKPFRKSFSVVKHGYDGARSKAIKWRRDRENGIPYVRPKGACGKYKGVCYNEAQKGWSMLLVNNIKSSILQIIFTQEHHGVRMGRNIVNIFL